MNLGQAVAVSLYELVRDGKSPRPAGETQGSNRPRCGTHHHDSVRGARTSGYMHSRPPAYVEEKVRRLVRRLNLESPDAKVWLGMLRQILWKQRSGKIGKNEDQKE